MTSFSISVAKVKADEKLRAFRQEGQRSWSDFNSVCCDLCNYMNCPANDVLLDTRAIGTSEYDRRLWLLTGDLLEGGVFGRDRPGVWKYGRYEG